MTNHTTLDSAPKGLMGRVTSGVDRVMQARLPDPLVIVVLLTLLVFALGVAAVGESPAAMVSHFGEGFCGFCPSRCR